jgi:hypothetical protein
LYSPVGLCGISCPGKTAKTCRAVLFFGGLMTYHFQVGQKNEAERLVLAYHYSRRVPANVQLVTTAHKGGGLFGDMGECVAGCFFSIPPTRWNENVWELSRLVRADNIDIRLSSLIGKSLKIIKKMKTVDLIVSFADTTHDHHGGIYQSCSWNYGGLRERRMDGLIVDGEFKPGRSCNSIYGTRSPSKLRGIFPNKKIEAHYDDGKHIYWKAVCKSGARKAERLRLKILPYPKPGFK